MCVSMCQAQCYALGKQKHMWPLSTWSTQCGIKYRQTLAKLERQERCTHGPCVIFFIVPFCLA